MFSFSDCEDKSGCQCNSYKPTIDLLQRCPKHGHLYQHGGALYPIQQRYNKDSRSVEHQIPDQIPTPSDRTKRSVANTFPFKIQEILPGLRPNNQIMKTPSSPVNENDNRIEEILKKNFGEDPRENIEELLRPKPLGSVKKIEGDVEPKIDLPAPETSDFMLNVKPKLEEARANFRSQISKIVNKARLSAIKAKHLISKRSADSKESDLSDVYSEDDSNFDGNFEPIWITDDSAEELDTKSAVNDPENANGLGEPAVDRIRKHCDRCGELAHKFPCPSCGVVPSQAQNFEMKQRNARPDQTPDHLAQPRYIFDQSGHRYVETNENIERDDVTVGSYHNQPNGYGQLQDILDQNSEALHSQNRGIGPGHLLQPMNFEHASDAIRFIQELTQRNNNQHNEDYYSNGNSYNVGSSSPNFRHSKRSFKIVPLAEKDDGSVFVKISPIRAPKLEHVSKIDRNIENSSNFSEKKSKTNFQKFVRNGKKYEILALNSNGENADGSVASEEDLEILKYVYALNQNGQTNGNAPTEKTEENESTNTNAQVET